jgi:endoglucanase
LATVSLVSLINVTPAAAHHAQTMYEQKVVVKHTGMCLNVAHARLYNSAPVVQATCTDHMRANNEIWTIQFWDTEWGTGHNYYRLIVNHTGKCLDVQYESKAHAAPVVQYDCGWRHNQQWRFVDHGDGWQYIVARHSGMCLNVAHASTAHAARVVQATCSNGDNEKWRHRYA